VNAAPAMAIRLTAFRFMGVSSNDLAIRSYTCYIMAQPMKVYKRPAAAGTLNSRKRAKFT
jgi:hypothetical protein